MNKNGLKPCPFCGEKDDIAIRERVYDGTCKSIIGYRYWYVECLPCDCRTGHCYNEDAGLDGYSSGKELAILTWNGRANDE